MQGKLRILMIAPTPYFSDRGCHVRIYEEAKALKARGHEVVIVAYHLGRDVDDIPVVRTPNIPWYRKLSAGPSWHKPYLDIFLLYKALITAKKFRPDVVHAHLHEGAFLVGVAKRLFGVPLLFDCQGSLCGELLDHGFMKKGGFLHGLFSRLEAWITRRADYIVTSSTLTAELIRCDFPDVAHRLSPFTDAVATEIFKPLPRDRELATELKLPDDKRLIVYLGAMTDYQGVDLLLEAISCLSKERDDFHLLLMGYPEQGYAKKVRQFGLSDKITLTGKIDYARAPQYLSLGDIAVSPKLSATEANGKLLNYMACGIPSVVFDSMVNREILGDCGVYVAQKSSHSFADGIKVLLDNPSQCADLSEQSRAHALRYHSWDARVEELMEIYARLLRLS